MSKPSAYVEIARSEALASFWRHSFNPDDMTGRDRDSVMLYGQCIGETDFWSILKSLEDEDEEVIGSYRTISVLSDGSLNWMESWRSHESGCWGFHNLVGDRRGEHGMMVALQVSYGDIYWANIRTECFGCDADQVEDMLRISHFATWDNVIL